MSKKVCPLKDEPPPGDLIYEKDGYAIYQIDGEEHKVSHPPKVSQESQVYKLHV